MGQQQKNVFYTILKFTQNSPGLWITYNIWITYKSIFHTITICLWSTHFLNISSSSEAFASELLEILKEMFPRYYMHSDMFIMFKSSATHWCVIQYVHLIAQHTTEDLILVVQYYQHFNKVFHQRICGDVKIFSFVLYELLRLTLSRRMTYYCVIKDLSIPQTTLTFVDSIIKETFFQDYCFRESRRKVSSLPTVDSKSWTRDFMDNTWLHG